jgi:phage-related minor tail protein
VGNKISGAGEKLLPVTTGVLALGTAAVKTASDFDSAMSKVAAVSGASGDELEALRNKAREMGQTTKFSASEAAEAMDYMAMAGWKTTDMLNGIDGVMNLAAASGEDLATTSDIVTDALTAFGLTADDSSHFADILAAASSNANTNVSMMGETFQYAAPVMGAMGYTAEDAAIAIGLMANSGIKASQAGTSLRGILTNLAAPTDKVANAMHDVGVSLDDGEGNMLSFREVMLQLREGFGDLKISVEDYAEAEEEINQQFENGEITEKEYNSQLDDLIEKTFGAEGALKAQAASAIAGKNAMSGLLAIINASDADFEKLTNAVDNCDGTALEMAEIMQDNLNGQLTILKSQLEELAISFGEMLMPTIRAIVTKIQEFVDKLNALDPSMKETIIKIALIAAAIGPLLIVIGKVISSIGSIMTFISRIPSMITAVQGGITTLTGDRLTSGIVDRLNALGFNFESFVDIIKTVWDALCNVLAPVFEGVFNQIANIFDTVTDVILSVLDVFIGLFTGNWDQCWNGIESIFTGIWDRISTILTNLKFYLTLYIIFNLRASFASKPNFS